MGKAVPCTPAGGGCARSGCDGAQPPRMGLVHEEGRSSGHHAPGARTTDGGRCSVSAERQGRETRVPAWGRRFHVRRPGEGARGAAATERSPPGWAWFTRRGDHPGITRREHRPRMGDAPPSAPRGREGRPGSRHGEGGSMYAGRGRVRSEWLRRRAAPHTAAPDSAYKRRLGKPQSRRAHGGRGLKRGHSASGGEAGYPAKARPKSLRLRALRVSVANSIAVSRFRGVGSSPASWTGRVVRWRRTGGCPWDWRGCRGPGRAGRG
jgi:hypothetical protein